MVDFVTEVQEELRKDDYNRWLRQYGPYVLGGLVAIIVGAGAWEWMKAKDARVATQSSITYETAAGMERDGELNAAVNRYEALSDKAAQGYAGLSQMRAANIRLSEDNIDGAVSHNDKAALAFELPRHAQLAQLKSAYMLAGEGRYGDVSARVAPLAQKGNPYEYLARELLGFAAKEQGNLAEARAQFSYLNTIPGVPDSIRLRAKQYLDVMKRDEAAKAASSATETETSNDQ